MVWGALAGTAPEIRGRRAVEFEKGVKDQHYFYFYMIYTYIISTHHKRSWRILEWRQFIIISSPIVVMLQNWCEINVSLINNVDSFLPMLLAPKYIREPIHFNQVTYLTIMYSVMSWKMSFVYVFTSSRFQQRTILCNNTTNW